MGIFTNKARKRMNHLLEVCNSYIDSYEDEKSMIPSAKNDINVILKKTLEAAYDEFKEWDGTENYDRIANAMLADITFDMLSSGKYHLYAGMLNPMNCTKNLRRIYEKAMCYAVQIGEITEKEKQEQLDLLRENISSIG